MTIRQGQDKDFPIVFKFIYQLVDEIDNATHRVTNSVALMKKEKKHFKFIVAEEKGKVIGVALYFIAYLVNTGKTLYLEVLFVDNKHRSKGVGYQLMQNIFKIALREKCGRVHWTVTNTNKNAITFYKKCGAEICDNQLLCDIRGANIKKFLEN